MSYKSDPRGTRPVRLVVLHTTEGALTAAALGAYFYRPDVMASSHVGIGTDGIRQYVSYSRSAWTVRSGNPISDNAEICGFAHWTREQWLNDHRQLLDLAAGWVRGRCLARGIPIRKLSTAEVAAGKAGVIGHWDWTVGMRDGTHTDPGTGFPWDYVMNRAAAGAPSKEDNDMQPTDAVKDPGPGKWGHIWLNAQQNAAAVRQQLAGLISAVAQLAADPNIDETKLAELLDAAVAKHTPTAEENAAQMLPVVTAAVHDALGADNADQADAIVNAIVGRLQNGATA